MPTMLQQYFLGGQTPSFGSGATKNRFVVNVNVVVTRDDKVLLVRQGRGYWMGKWALPGGAHTIGESLEECGVREVKEETNMDVKIEELIGAHSSYDPWSAFELQVVLISYRAHLIGGEAHPDSDVDAVGWFTPEEIRDMHKRRLVPDLVLQILEEAGLL